MQHSIAVIAVIKGLNVVAGYVIHKKFVPLHSIMNKVVGFLLFVLPLTLHFIEVRYSAAVVCVVATFAALRFL